MDGIVLINKGKGISSFGVVSKVRKIFNIKKVGHCGTLDPEATGVLPIMIGNATKVSKYLIEHDKEYIAVLKLGIKTDTADQEGNIIDNDNFILEKDKKEEYKTLIEKMVGKQKQLPPMYSAIKVNGKKLYEYARAGQEIERKEREIEIYKLQVENIDFENNEITFRVACSKGTYIRTLCETIADSLGTIGYMKELQRTKVDKFLIGKSITISELEKSEDKYKHIISIEEIFKEKEKINLNDRRTKLFLNGVQLTLNLEEGLYRIYCNDKFLGLGTIKNSTLKRDIIIE